MRILILGGTRFLGRAVAEEAVAAGYDVTTFNRGKSGPDVRGVVPVRGDREDADDLALLTAGRFWDAVIDTSGHVPRTVSASAQALAWHADRYVFVSSASVYQDWPAEPLTEDSPVLDCPPDGGPHRRGGYLKRYGFQKAGCERAVTSFFPGAAVILRPSVILGPREYSGRLPWWLGRIEYGGVILAPGDPERLIQPVDVRDAAAFAVEVGTSGLAGVFNVAAPRGSATYGGLLEACRRITGSDAVLKWVSDEFLLRHRVRQWSQIPLWSVRPGSWNLSCSRAQAAGLACRPITDTVAGTWRWMSAGGTAIGDRCRDGIGLDPVTEQALLTAWQRSRSPGS